MTRNMELFLAGVKYEISFINQVSLKKGKVVKREFYLNGKKQKDGIIKIIL